MGLSDLPKLWDVKFVSRGAFRFRRKHLLACAMVWTKRRRERQVCPAVIDRLTAPQNFPKISQLAKDSDIQIEASIHSRAHHGGRTLVLPNNLALHNACNLPRIWASKLRPSIRSCANNGARALAFPKNNLALHNGWIQFFSVSVRILMAERSFGNLTK